MDNAHLYVVEVGPEERPRPRRLLEQTRLAQWTLATHLLTQSRLQKL